MHQLKTLLTALVLLISATLLNAQTTSTAVINATGFPYTWSVSGQTYPAPGMYNYTDPASGVQYTLDLRGAASLNEPLQKTYTYISDTFYTYIIPRTGWYFIEVSGAQGGSVNQQLSRLGGKGARVQGYVRLLTGQQLRIAVGEAGKNSQVWFYGHFDGGGGGGGSSVVLVNGSNYTPLLIAGGGGGAGQDQNGFPGLITTNGGLAWGGSNGGGGGLGADSDKRGGAGGGGFSGNGQSHFENNGTTLLAEGGKSYLNGNRGGNRYYPYSYEEGNGGWGGGGQGGPVDFFLTGGGGGGGGYSGGGGARLKGEGGGGGGSYVTPTAITSGLVQLEGIQSGNGSVTIERLEYDPAIQPQNNIFNFQGNTFQYFTAPATGYYLISARGAQGGGYNNAVPRPNCPTPLPTYNGGKGAHMQGYVVLKKGQVYRVAVGGMGGGIQWNGRTSPCGEVAGGGGGGASSVVYINQLKHLPILFAGGGGGASKWANGGDATTSGSGTNTTAGSIQTIGGTNGNGGQQGGLDGAGGAGGGFLTNGGNWVNNNVTVTGGQGYVNGNYGGTNPNNTGTGGWGGGSAGANVHVVSGTSAQYYSGGGGGGGGYSGGAGASNGNRTTPSNSGGGGGGSFSSALGGRADSSGVNTGNGLVTIYGPNVSTEEITVSGPSYTWPANGNTYFEAGTWLYVDKQNFVVRVLNLSFGTPVNCGSYTTYDTTVVDTTQSYYTWYRNGRLYTENTVDSIRIGCNKYILRLTVAPPATYTAPSGGGTHMMRQINMGEPEAQGLLQTTLGYDWSAKSYRACRNSTATFTMSEVPFATSYNWILPNGATGSSNTNEITVSFGNSFTGGLLGVAPVNAVGVGDTLVMNLNLAITPPTGRLIISKTPAPFVSGYYEVTPIAGATTYTWSVSNAQASIIRGQGQPRIQLEQMPGFNDVTVTVVASNCKGIGPRTQIRLKESTRTNGNNAVARTMVTELPVSIYPNPSDGRYTLSTPSLKSNALLEVYSVDGRRVYRKQIPAHTSQSSIILPNTAPAGLYHVRLLSEGGVKTMRVVKQ